MTRPSEAEVTLRDALVFVEDTIAAFSRISDAADVAQAEALAVRIRAALSTPPLPSAEPVGKFPPQWSDPDNNCAQWRSRYDGLAVKCEALRQDLSPSGRESYRVALARKDAAFVEILRLAALSTPPECVLSDGSVVTHNVPKRHGVYEWTRTYPRPGTVVSKSNNYWQALVDTGADFEKLQAFVAAEVGQ